MLKTGPLPVGLNDHVTTLLATTPGSQTSWFMQAIKMIEPTTGLPIIPLKRTYKPCDMHAKTATPWVCACKMDKRASWKNPVRERIWEPLWQADKETFVAENLGVEIDMGGSVFNSAWVERLRIRPPFEITGPVRWIYIAMDPAEGGKDEFAIVAMALIDTVWVILYMDSFRLIQSDRELQNDHVTCCINFLRQHRIYKLSSLIYIPENLPGSRGGELAYYLRNITSSMTMAEYGPDRRPGVPKTPQSTQNMMLRTKAALHDGCLQFAHDMGTYRGVPRATIIQQCCDQLLAFRFDEKTKKLSGKAEGGRDDLLVALMMPLYWSEVFRNHPSYAGFRSKELRRPLIMKD